MPRRIAQRGVDRDDVGVGDGAQEIVVATRECDGGAERLDEPRRLTTDPPRADDEHRLSVEALTEHELQRELPRVPPPDEAVTFRDPAQQ